MIICDRFEEDFGVFYEDDKRFNVPVEKISPAVCEGDVVYLENDIYLPDKEQTENLREYNKMLLEKLGL